VQAGVQGQPDRKANRDFPKALHGFNIPVETPLANRSCKGVEGCLLRVEGQEECSSNDRRRPLNILLCFSQAPYKRLKSGSDKKPWRFAMVACEMTSNNEPVAISTKRAKSGRDDRELPSARFDEIETTAASLVCQIKPFFVGKRSGDGINGIRKLNCLLPDSQFFKVEHFLIEGCVMKIFTPSTLNFQPSTIRRLRPARRSSRRGQ